MNKNIKNILREKIIRINLRKVEIKNKLLKSLIQNNNITNIIKIYANYTINKNKNTSVSRKNKICFYTGKRGSVLYKFNFSRYTIKKLILQNRLTNFKKNN
jgi:ribosomal protein S14